MNRKKNPAKRIREFLRISFSTSQSEGLNFRKGQRLFISEQAVNAHLPGRAPPPGPHAGSN
jgi:hypothetical protein